MRNYLSAPSTFCSHVLIALLMAGMLSLATPRPASSQTAASTPESPGEKLFLAVCATCHSVQPPAKLAPPMAMIMQRYRKALGSDDAIRATILEWVPNPDTERSLMPPMAIEHHGLMPPITTLSDSELNQITDYLLTLTPEKGGMKGEMKGNKGKGMQMDKDKQTGQERKHKKHGSN